MLVHSRRRSFIDAYLDLPIWLRAPLSLGEQKRVYVVASANDKYCSLEINISAIPRFHWDDLWRIELEIYDRVGFIADFTDFLKSLRIKVIAMESGLVLSGAHHVLSFIVSCKEYYSPKDRDTDTRAKRDVCILFDLQRDIGATFVEDIILRKHAKLNARIKIRRLSYHRQLAIELTPPYGGNIFYYEDVMKNGKVAIPNSLFEHYLSEDMEQTAVSISLCDTKERVSRSIIYFDQEMTPCHIIVIFRNSPAVLRRIIDIMRSKGCDIIQSQVRLGVCHALSDKHADNVDYSQLDVTFTHTNKNRPGLQRTVDSIRHQIETDVELSRANVRVTPCLGCTTRRCLSL